MISHQLLWRKCCGSNYWLRLPIVDLPGLIGGSEDDESVELVRSLVNHYFQESHTIIRAVLQQVATPKPNQQFDKLDLLTRRESILLESSPRLI